VAGVPVEPARAPLPVPRSAPPPAPALPTDPSACAEARASLEGARAEARALRERTGGTEGRALLAAQSALDACEEDPACPEDPKRRAALWVGVQRAEESLARAQAVVATAEAATVSLERAARVACGAAP
jgi:hypothetical protein